MFQCRPRVYVNISTSAGASTEHSARRHATYWWILPIALGETCATEYVFTRIHLHMLTNTWMNVHERNSNVQNPMFMLIQINHINNHINLITVIYNQITESIYISSYQLFFLAEFLHCSSFLFFSLHLREKEERWNGARSST